MAVFPCDFSRHRYRQPQQSVYYTEVSEHLVSTYKLRLCPEHFATVRELFKEHMDVLDISLFASDRCQSCHEPANFAVSAKLFPLKAEEEHLVADLCANCASVLGNNGHVYNGERLASS